MGVSSLVVKVSKFLEKAKNRPCKGLIVDQITFVRGSRTDQMQIALEDLLLQAKQDLISSFQTEDDLVCAKFSFRVFSSLCWKLSFLFWFLRFSFCFHHCEI